MRVKKREEREEKEEVEKKKWLGAEMSWMEDLNLVTRFIFFLAHIQ